MLNLSGIKKTYNRGDVTRMCLFDGFDLSVKDGEFVSIVGSNGSGKTSLLNIICGDIPVEEGEIRIDGEVVNKLPSFRRYQKIGRVYQNPAMGTCAQLTILENMALADNKGGCFGLLPAVNKKRIDYYRTLVAECGMGLENRMNVKVGALSGGQRQALALVIANMTDIRLLILDEHTAALDPKTSENVMKLTDKLVKEKKITTLMVTHNLRFALEYGNRIVMMHEGSIVLDKNGAEKNSLVIDDLLGIFNQISIECGN